MCVVMAMVDWGRDEDDGWYACGTKPGRQVGRMSGNAGALLECEVTPLFRCAALGRVDPELVGLSGKP